MKNEELCPPKILSVDILSYKKLCLHIQKVLRQKANSGLIKFKEIYLWLGPDSDFWVNIEVDIAKTSFLSDFDFCYVKQIPTFIVLLCFRSFIWCVCVCVCVCVCLFMAVFGMSATPGAGKLRGNK